MRFIPFLLFFSFINFSSRLFAQDTLPDISVKNFSGKIIVSWTYNYSREPKVINIQRSPDSLKNYITIGSVLYPQNRQNAFTDSKPPHANMYYRVFVAYDGGSYLFSKMKRSPVYIADEIKKKTKDTITVIQEKKIIPEIVNTPSISANITNAICSARGSATLIINHIRAPYTIIWNTDPVQKGVTAYNLQPGNYQATITDAAGNITVYPVSISQINTLSIKAHNDTLICPGASFYANTIGNASNYSWSPETGISNPSIANPVLSPSASTTYTVTGTKGNCKISSIFTVTIQPPVTLSVNADTTIYYGVSFDANIKSNAANYRWSPKTALSNPNIPNPVITPVATTMYTVTASTGNCSISRSFKVTVLPAIYHIYTGKENNVIISLSDADKKRYTVKFFEESGKLLFEMNKLHDTYLVVDKTNFVHAGWFHFEIYLDGRMVEKNKFFLSKDDKVQPAAGNEKGKKNN